MEIKKKKSFFGAKRESCGGYGLTGIFGQLLVSSNHNTSPAAEEEAPQRPQNPSVSVSTSRATHSRWVFWEETEEEEEETEGLQCWRLEHEEEKAWPVMKLPWPPVLLPTPSLPPRTRTPPETGRHRRDPCPHCPAPQLPPATHSFPRLHFLYSFLSCQTISASI